MDTEPNSRTAGPAPDHRMSVRITRSVQVDDVKTLRLWLNERLIISHAEIHAGKVANLGSKAIDLIHEAGFKIVPTNETQPVCPTDTDPDPFGKEVGREYGAEDGTRDTLDMAKPWKGTIHRWRAQTCCGLGKGYLIMGLLVPASSPSMVISADSKMVTTSYVVDIRGNQIETNDSRYDLVEASDFPRMDAESILDAEFPAGTPIIDNGDRPRRHERLVPRHEPDNNRAGDAD